MTEEKNTKKEYKFHSFLYFNSTYYELFLGIDGAICCSSCFLMSSNGFVEYSVDWEILLNISIFA